MQNKFTYKIEFSIFGKQMISRIPADSSAEACEKFMIAIFKKLKIDDITIYSQSGEEADADEYISQAQEMKGKIIERMNGFSQKFSEN